jgi:HAD superfamily hydrolase (TIGR01490 family)
MSSPAIAFFDLDHTLIAINSAKAWMHRERQAGRMGRRDTARAIFWFAMYRLGTAKMDDVVRSAVLTLQDQDADLFRTRTRAFWHEEVEATIRPGATRAVERHRDLGHRLVLLTASSRQLGEVAAEHFRLHDVLANDFEQSDGRFTGQVREPLCYGDGKVHHARSYAKSHGIDLRDCAFYTDSFSDLRTLELVGRPVCVAPDPRLARAAKKRGWSVEDWD